MKVAFAASTAFFDSAAASPTLPRFSGAVRASRLSRRTLLRIEDQASNALEVALRVLLGSSLLAAMGACFWQLAQF